ncbi:MAG: hypothetical protein Q9175_004835 [Cornicularia normoerica]
MSSSAGKCFYDALGVPPYAHKQEIKNAYRRLALRFHPDKNQGDPSAKELFQEIQAAYEALSEDDKRAKYDTTAGFVPSNPSTRRWREPTYDAYTRDPPFWPAELRDMTVQKCARITKIQHIECEIRELVDQLNDLVDAEERAVSKENKARAWYFVIKSRPPKVNLERKREFLLKSAFINTHLDRIKNELRTAHEDHKKMLEKDKARKTWWARERVKRVEEKNRRAATRAAEAEAARRRAETASGHGERDQEAARAAEEIRQQAQEEATRLARAARAEEAARKRAEREREDPEAVKKAQREAQEWLARQREKVLGPNSREGGKQDIFGRPGQSI